MRDEEEPWDLKKIERVVSMTDKIFIIGPQMVEDATLCISLEDVTCIAFFPQAEAEIHNIKGGSTK
jgi:hypothetical protein